MRPAPRHSDTSTRTLRPGNANPAADAAEIQQRAAGGVASVTQLGGLVLFSSHAGDAWMLDPAAGRAIYLARGFELREVPRLGLDRQAIAWEADYVIEGGVFTVHEPGGARTIYATRPWRSNA